MKRLATLILLAAILTSSGCKLIDDLRTFEIPYSTSIVVQANGGIINLPINLPTPDIETNSEETFSNEGIQHAWVDKVELKSCILTITSPSGEDFSFLENIRVFISSDNVAEIVLASKVPVPENVGNSFEMETSDDNLHPYIQEDSFDLRTNLTTDETVFQDVTIRIDMVCEVRATIP